MQRLTLHQGLQCECNLSSIIVGVARRRIAITARIIKHMRTTTPTTIIIPTAACIRAGWLAIVSFAPTAITATA